MAQKGKKYIAAQEQITQDLYSLEEACALVKKTSITSFDGTVEIHIVTGADPKHADQLLRGTISLPHGTGKSVKVAVFCESADEAAAKEAGADAIGGEDLIETVAGGEISFDVAIATPAMMKSLAKVARVLGPKGLMPSPKSGTVTPDVAKAVTELKAGRIEYKVDKSGIVHSILGKVSFGERELTENAQALLKSMSDNKPSGVKGALMKSISLSSTMGPGINVDMASVEHKA